jgi:hypothetical protein
MPKAAAKRKPPITAWFSQWLSAKDTAETFKEGQENLRVKVLDAVQEWGEEDADGHIFYDLPKPVEFTDRNGEVKIYTTLKRERHLTPAQPLPDAEKALALLKEKGLWLTEKELKVIQDLETRCPYAVISVDIDPDAVATAYYRDQLTEAEYEGILAEQRETFQFRQVK